jgi:signal transduction histidine kinase
LDIGRIEAGVDMEMAPYDVSAIAQIVMEEFRETACQKNQQLLYQGEGQAASVLGNELRLRQVINNLIGNAIKYTPEGGEIRLQVEQEGGIVLLRVEDNGIGIPPGDLPYIFDKFYRVENDETADIQGTGLGLSICKSVVEQHGGQIWAESVHGQGSTFHVALPGIK